MAGARLTEELAVLVLLGMGLDVAEVVVEVMTVEGSLRTSHISHSAYHLSHEVSTRRAGHMLCFLVTLNAEWTRRLFPVVIDLTTDVSRIREGLLAVEAHEMVLFVRSETLQGYTVVRLTERLNVLIIQNILSALGANVFECLAIALYTVEAVLAHEATERYTYVPHAAIFRAERLSALTAVKTTAVIALSSHLDNFATELRIAEITITVDPCRLHAVSTNHSF